MTYTGISLFSGAVDGLAIAARAAGINVTHHIEWDAWCCRVLRMNHPESIVLNKDIHDVHVLPTTDIIFGGSPCQDFSNAGNGAGFDGSRYLWPEMFRIVRANRPRVVIHENVRGGVSKGLLDRISNNLESAGYETTALVFPACVFGAPHERYRMLHIGLLADTSKPGQQEHDASRIAGDSGHTTRRNSQAVGNTTRQHYEDIGAIATASRFNPEPAGSNRSVGKSPIDDRRPEILGLSNDQRRILESRLGGIADGTTTGLHRFDPLTDFPGWPAGQGIYQHAYEPARTTAQKGKYAKERIQALGNAVVWQQAQPVFKAVVRWLDEGLS